MPLLLLGTIYAIRHRWIEVKTLGGYRFSAAQTKPILTLLDAAQRGGNAIELDSPTPCNLLCHRLTLQRVHTRQAADATLVEFDRRLLLLTGAGKAQQFLPPLGKLRSQGSNIDVRSLIHKSVSHSCAAGS